MNNYCWSWLGLGILLICSINYNNGQTSGQKVLPLSQRLTNNQNTIPGWNSGQQQNSFNPNFNNNAQVSNYREVNPDISQLISNSVMNMSLNFASLFAKYSLSGSQIYSPVSIASALSLLHLGSKGQTFHEINNFLGYNRYSYPTSEIHRQFGLIVRDLISSARNPERPDEYWKTTVTMQETFSNQNSRSLNEPDESQKLNIANGVFVQYGFSLRPDYENVVKNTYKSEILNLNFQNEPQQSKNYINQWVNYHTNGKIPVILNEEIKTDTNMLLTNALYFKGYWEKKFTEAPINNFYPDGVQGNSINVKMIASVGGYPYYEDRSEGFQMIGIPYKGSLTTMYLIQPFDSTRQRLYEFQRSKLSAERIDHWISQMVRKTAIIVMPKMHITNGFNLKPILSELGMSRLFSKAHGDFSLISGQSSNTNSNFNVQNRVPVQTVSNQQRPVFNSPNVNVQQQERPIQISFPERFGGDDDEDNTNNTSTNNETLTQNVNEKDSLKINHTIYAQNLNTTQRVNKNETQTDSKRSRRSVTYKVESSVHKSDEPLRFKDFVLNKRITKSNPGKKLIRNRRQISSQNSLQNLDVLRNSPDVGSKPPLWVEDIVHKVDLVINEVGTEGAAATAVTFRKNGPDVTVRLDTPYIILIRHDTTKMPLFYGPIYEPSFH